LKQNGEENVLNRFSALILGNIYTCTIKDLILILLFYRVSAFRSYYDEPKKARRKKDLNRARRNYDESKIRT
jgi:hypothetical protein